jgi:glycosyltransferase involved in cell wall biosynthesis
VRGIGRYLQILKENFSDWTFSNKLQVTGYKLQVFLNPFFNFLQKPVTLKKIAKKQIAVIHDLIPLKYPSKFPAGLRGNFNIFLNKLSLKNYDLIVTDSEASKKDIIQILKIPEEKVKVIYPCLPKIFKKVSSSKYQVLREKTKKEKPLNTDYLLLNTNFCLYVGDATWNKNLVNLARAIKIANVTCVFVGKIFESFKTFHASRFTFNFNHPWQKELKEFFQLIKDDKRFIFLGYVDDEDLIKLYQQAILNILPSRDEGFGFSYLEASSQGCPSILSDIPVFKEIAKDTAFFANPENPNDLADKIIELYFDKNRQKTLGDAAKKRSQFFSCKKFKKGFLEVID